MRARERQTEEKREHRRARRRRPAERTDHLHGEPVPESAPPSPPVGYEPSPPLDPAGPVWSSTATPHDDWDEPDPGEQHWAPAPHRPAGMPVAAGSVPPLPPVPGSSPDRGAGPHPDGTPAGTAPDAPAGNGPFRAPHAPVPAADRGQPIEERLLLPVRKVH